MSNSAFMDDMIKLDIFAFGFDVSHRKQYACNLAMICDYINSRKDSKFRVFNGGCTSGKVDNQDNGNYLRAQSNIGTFMFEINYDDNSFCGIPNVSHNLMDYERIYNNIYQNLREQKFISY
jgi:hypothetical protein